MCVTLCVSIDINLCVTLCVSIDINLCVTLCVSIDINFYNDNNEIMNKILWSVDLRDIIAKTENRIIYEIKYMNIYDINLSTFMYYLIFSFSLRLHIVKIINKT
jgi:uncharacterized membrane protein YagU involved in acid resistance